MKLLSLALVLLLTSAFTGADIKEQLIGKWSGTEGGELGSFIFDSDGFITIENNGEITGGREFQIKEKKAQANYFIDDSTTPFKIDIVFSEIETKSVIGKLEGIFELMDDGRMRIAFGFGYTKMRPTNFDDSVILVKER